MKASIIVLAGVLAAAGPIVGSSYAQTEAAPVAVTGEVIRFEPGRVLVIRTDGREVTYNLNPSLVVPSEVQMGRNVTVHTERGADGNTSVTRVTTTSVTAEGQVKRTTEETRVGEMGDVSKKTTTVTGEVISFVPGRTIVIRGASGQNVTLALGPGVTLPAEVKVGQNVSVYTVPGPDGSTTVSRVLTTSVTPEGQMKRTVEETRTKPTGESTKTTTVTTVQGKVETYVPGKSITVMRADGTQTTYAIGAGAQLPSSIPVGKTVTIRTLPNGSVETVIVEQN
jgi:hypothetical protein